MPLVNPLALLRHARAHQYAIGAFNVNNLETIQSVIGAAEHCNTPVILQTSQGAINYAGIEQLYCMIATAAAHSPIPVTLHLDHGTDLAIIKQAIKIGYTSVMIDVSAYTYQKNIQLTKQVVTWAHKKKVCVEAELGTLGGNEDLIHGKIQYTDPELAKDFAEQTGCDTLAVAIGTSHGAHKLQGEPHINLTLLAQIAKKVSIPLVLHGASMLSSKSTNRAKKAGVKLSHTKGIPLQDIKQAITYGIAKINTDTDLRIAFDTGVREFMKYHAADIDARHVLSNARTVMQKTIQEHIKIFGTQRTR